MIRFLANLAGKIWHNIFIIKIMLLYQIQIICGRSVDKAVGDTVVNTLFCFPQFVQQLYLYVT